MLLCHRYKLSPSRVHIDSYANFCYWKHESGSKLRLMFCNILIFCYKHGLVSWLLFSPVHLITILSPDHRSLKWPLKTSTRLPQQLSIATRALIYAKLELHEACVDTAITLHDMHFVGFLFKLELENEELAHTNWLPFVFLFSLNNPSIQTTSKKFLFLMFSLLLKHPSLRIAKSLLKIVKTMLLFV